MLGRIRGTAAETDTLGELERARRPPSPPDSPPPQPVDHQWGVGQPLAPAPLPPPIPLSPEQEAAVLQRIQELVVLGREAKIEHLIGKLRELPLPATTRGELDEWIATFRTIDPPSTDRRFSALVLLSVRLLGPACLRAAPLEQEVLLQVDDLCREIMETMIPPSINLDKILQSCAEILGSKQHQEQAALLTAIRALHDRLMTLAGSLQVLKGELEGHLEHKERVDDEAGAATRPLADRVNALTAQFATLEQEGTSLFAQDDEVRQEVRRVLEECQKFASTML